MKILEFFILFLVTVQSAKVNLPKYRTPRDHCRQRAPVGIVLSSSGTSQLGMFDTQGLDASEKRKKTKLYNKKKYKKILYNNTYIVFFFFFFFGRI